MLQFLLGNTEIEWGPCCQSLVNQAHAQVSKECEGTQGLYYIICMDYSAWSHTCRAGLQSPWTTALPTSGSLESPCADLPSHDVVTLWEISGQWPGHLLPTWPQRLCGPLLHQQAQALPSGVRTIPKKGRAGCLQQILTVLGCSSTVLKSPECGCLRHGVHAERGHLLGGEPGVHCKGDTCGMISILPLQIPPPFLLPLSLKFFNLLMGLWGFVIMSESNVQYMFYVFWEGKNLSLLSPTPEMKS